MKRRDREEEARKGAKMEFEFGFIGLGNMASAMIGGALKKGLIDAGRICGSAKTERSRKKAEEAYGIQTFANNRQVAQRAQIIVLAVKPQFFEEVLEELKDMDWSNKTLVSLAPGKTIEWLCGHTKADVPAIRCMPNTPALVGEGCTGVCMGQGVTKEAAERVMRLLESFGRAVEVPERLMDVVVGVSGSSPAYVFMFIEAMADAAVAEGMPRAQAYELAGQAVLGSAKMVLETGMHPGALKDMVCSPGGTTIQAVKVLEEKKFRGTVMDAVTACIEKSRTM